MAVEIKVPTLGESVTSATIARWLKQPGERVAADEPVVELETEKVTVEVNAPAAGVLGPVQAAEGAEVAPGAVLATIEAGDPAIAAAAPKQAAAPKPVALAQAPAAHPAGGVNPPPRPSGPVSRPATPPSDVTAEHPAPPVLAHAPMPAAAKLMRERGVATEQVGGGTGKDGRITKGDVLAFISRPQETAAAPTPATKPAHPAEAGEERVRMTRLRRTIATRLKEAQNTAAMLTTFNEVDMSAAMALRNEYRDAFEKKYGVRLGFMAFFVTACVAALKQFPAVNAEIDGEEIVYKHFVHMGIAVGGPSGLVVPVIRDVDRMGFAEIEQAIADFGKRTREGSLKLEELTGGTFSITNGGVYGSLMSTPILNPPQSGILGMHKIQERPIAVNGQIAIRPMMYLALTYDHRIVDGREAVSFLVRVKEGVEDPRRLLLAL